MNLLTQKNQDFKNSHGSLAKKKKWLPLTNIFGMMRTLVILIIMGLIIFLMWPTIAEWFGLVTQTIK